MGLHGRRLRGREGQHGLGREWGWGRCFRDGQPGTATTFLLSQKKQLVLVLKDKNFPTELRKKTFTSRNERREGLLLRILRMSVESNCAWMCICVRRLYWLLYVLRQTGQGTALGTLPALW